ncbi:hypothetical protein LNQ82_05870 [Conchiformibius steedae DSM 2580]|uniref:Uncharacterized protein n=3 Tax=Conchiformibius steedae TaxID=153493 RepID=A0A3P2A266_9NEIS|nr:hypothetical protein [Conchiformibius steedae]QMT33992.1 hypothetical protein H3L98_02950 [Conchiformibius steedae]RRD89522.1 hypothetical protein EII21_08415 [Conchiformibius steedae]URD66762.1 hypothetical protein LNQ82_05870 [Conchiformibius steedae DSM 2580]
MKRLFSAAAVLVFSAAAAANGNPAANQAELANAQMRYQALVKAQTTDQAELVKLRSRLYAAEQRLIQANLEVNRLRAELLLLQDIHQKNTGELKNAGDRLDKAWRAVYGR